MSRRGAIGGGRGGGARECKREAEGEAESVCGSEHMRERQRVCAADSVFRLASRSLLPDMTNRWEPVVQLSPCEGDVRCSDQPDSSVGSRGCRIIGSTWQSHRPSPDPSR